MYQEIDWATADGDEIVCHCMGVNKRTILEAIEAGAFTVPLLKTMTQAGRGKDCKRRHPLARNCEQDLEALLDLYNTGPTATKCSCGCGC